MEYSQEDLNYLSACYDIALQSNDPSTQNGVIIVDSGSTIIEGWNDFPREIVQTEDRYINDKYLFVEHAERTAIHGCAKLGYCLYMTTMYACWSACADCARAIIESGIKKLVRHKTSVHDTHGSWSKSIKIGDIMLKEAGVKVIDIEVYLGKTIRFMGEQVTV